MKFLLAILAFFILDSCGSDNFPKYVALGGLRVLALRADLTSQFNGTAEFSPGDTVVITPYISYYTVAGAITYQATGCIDPGVSYGSEPSCANVPGATSLGAGTVTISSGASNTGEANSFSASIPSTLLSGRSSSDQYNGVNYLVTYQLTSSSGARVASFKRLPVSTATKTKNQNPIMTNITSNGTALSSMPSGDSNLAANYPAASRETFSTMRYDGSLSAAVEDLTTTYFITDGSLKYFRTVNDQTTVYTPPSPPPADHTPIIVGVIRDGRGGVSVKVQPL